MPDQPTAGRPAAADPLRAAEAALRQAQLTNDAEALERLLDDELVFTGPDGAIYGKADDLHAHRQRRPSPLMCFAQVA